MTLSHREMKELAKGAATEAELLAAIVDFFAPARQANYKTIDRRTLLFNLSCLLLVTQIALWGWLLLNQ